ncbi:MAG: phosphoribosylglycinamide formyltransferase, partial [Bacteroidales bacterium]|nr:phosphoribosylglycinamide formyltransferase [Bacteroidales bacterium]
PKYGGKGMYGSRVHRAVIEAGESESGISIHYVNPEYDEGDIIFQARCDIEPGESPDSLAEKIHELEYKFFPTVVENLLKKL